MMVRYGYSSLQADISTIVIRDDHLISLFTGCHKENQQRLKDPS